MEKKIDNPPDVRILSEEDKNQTVKNNVGKDSDPTKKTTFNKMLFSGKSKKSIKSDISEHKLAQQNIRALADQAKLEIDESMKMLRSARETEEKIKGISRQNEYIKKQYEEALARVLAQEKSRQEKDFHINTQIDKADTLLQKAQDNLLKKMEFDSSIKTDIESIKDKLEIVESVQSEKNQLKKNIDLCQTELLEQEAKIKTLHESFEHALKDIGIKSKQNKNYYKQIAIVCEESVKYKEKIENLLSESENVLGTVSGIQHEFKEDLSNFLSKHEYFENHFKEMSVSASIQLKEINQVKEFIEPLLSQCQQTHAHTSELKQSAENTLQDVEKYASDCADIMTDLVNIKSYVTSKSDSIKKTVEKGLDAVQEIFSQQETLENLGENIEQKTNTVFRIYDNLQDIVEDVVNQKNQVMYKYDALQGELAKNIESLAEQKEEMQYAFSEAKNVLMVATVAKKVAVKFNQESSCKLDLVRQAEKHTEDLTQECKIILDECHQLKEKITSSDHYSETINNDLKVALNNASDIKQWSESVYSELSELKILMQKSSIEQKEDLEFSQNILQKMKQHLSSIEQEKNKHIAVLNAVRSLKSEIDLVLEKQQKKEEKVSNLIEKVEIQSDVLSEQQMQVEKSVEEFDDLKFELHQQIESFSSVSEQTYQQELKISSLSDLCQDNIKSSTQLQEQTQVYHQKLSKLSLDAKHAFKDLHNRAVEWGNVKEEMMCLKQNLQLKDAKLDQKLEKNDENYSVILALIEREKQRESKLLQLFDDISKVKQKSSQVLTVAEGASKKSNHNMGQVRACMKVVESLYNQAQEVIEQSQDTLAQCETIKEDVSEKNAKALSENLQIREKIDQQSSSIEHTLEQVDILKQQAQQLMSNNKNLLSEVEVLLEQSTDNLKQHVDAMVDMKTLEQDSRQQILNGQEVNNKAEGALEKISQLLAEQEEQKHKIDELFKSNIDLTKNNHQVQELMAEYLGQAEDLNQSSLSLQRNTQDLQDKIEKKLIQAEDISALMQEDKREFERLLSHSSDALISSRSIAQTVEKLSGNLDKDRKQTQNALTVVRQTHGSVQKCLSQLEQDRKNLISCFEQAKEQQKLQQLSEQKQKLLLEETEKIQQKNMDIEASVLQKMSEIDQLMSEVTTTHEQNMLDQERIKQSEQHLKHMSDGLKELQSQANTVLIEGCDLQEKSCSLLDKTNIALTKIEEQNTRVLRACQQAEESATWVADKDTKIQQALENLSIELKVFKDFENKAALIETKLENNLLDQVQQNNRVESLILQAAQGIEKLNSQELDMQTLKSKLDTSSKALQVFARSLERFEGRIDEYDKKFEEQSQQAQVFSIKHADHDAFERGLMDKIDSLAKQINFFETQQSDKVNEQLLVLDSRVAKLESKLSVAFKQADLIAKVHRETNVLNKDTALLGKEYRLTLKEMQADIKELKYQFKMLENPKLDSRIHETESKTSLDKQDQVLHESQIVQKNPDEIDEFSEQLERLARADGTLSLDEENIPKVSSKNGIKNFLFSFLVVVSCMPNLYLPTYDNIPTFAYQFFRLEVQHPAHHFVGPKMQVDSSEDSAVAVIRTSSSDVVIERQLFWPIPGVEVGAAAEYAFSRNGVYLQAPLYTPVVAIDEGKVLYSGNGKGFLGKMIVVQHTGDLMSIYGNVNARYVYSGDQVVQGQVIASVGSERSVRTELYFELRYQGYPRDPFLYYLSPSSNAIV